MQTKSSKKTSLLEVLHELSPESSKNTLRSWIEKGRVLVNGKPAYRPHQTVERGQEVLVGARPKFLTHDLKIVYEDKDLVVIDKPAGLLSVATEMERECSAHSLLKRRYHTRLVYPVHRLDKETSGLLVFAYTCFARDHLKEQLERRTMKREYEALVHGHPGEGTWHCFLREEKNLFVYVCPTERGKEAITHFTTLKVQGDFSLLKLRLETGRKHQIRVQAAHAGYPIVGDAKYGKSEDKKKGLQLRAVALSFFHPRKKTVMYF